MDSTQFHADTPGAAVLKSLHTTQVGAGVSKLVTRSVRKSEAPERRRFRLFNLGISYHVPVIPRNSHYYQVTALQRAFCIGLLSLITFSLSSCYSPRLSAKYSVTVDVDDNGAIVSGSSVQQIDCAFAHGISKGFGNPSTCRIKGEAVFVDLGSRGLLFILLTEERNDQGVRRGQSNTAWGIFENANKNLYDPVGETEQAFERIITRGLPVDAPAEQAPMLVRFRDLNDSTSVERVDPQNLEASFGRGVQIKRIRVALTNDPLTTGIETRLPWLLEGPPNQLLTPMPGKQWAGSGRIYYQAGVPFLRLLAYEDFWSFMR